MSWIDAVDNNSFLRALFPNNDPPLDSVRLHEVQLHQDGPALCLRFDLNDYPERPPAKWEAAKSNTVQVRLIGVGVGSLMMRGWTSNNIGRLVVKGRAPVIEVEFQASGCEMAAAFDWLRVDSVTAYRNEDPERQDRESDPNRDT